MNFRYGRASGSPLLSTGRGVRGEAWEQSATFDTSEITKRTTPHPRSLPMKWSADFQIGALEKPGTIALIWKSALRCAFNGSKREIFRGNLSALRGEGGPHPDHFELNRPQRGTKYV